MHVNDAVLHVGYTYGISIELAFKAADGLVAWQEFIRALEMAMNELSSPLTICQECLTQRENRTGVDKIRDEVELALLKVTTYCLQNT